MVLKEILRFLFTWWNGITVGTKLYTYFNGKKVGEDYFGNFYYESKDKKIVGVYILMNLRLQN